MNLEELKKEMYSQVKNFWYDPEAVASGYSDGTDIDLDKVFDWFVSKLSQHDMELVEKIKKLKTHDDYSTSCICDQCGNERAEIVQNSAIDTVISLITENE